MKFARFFALTNLFLLLASALLSSPNLYAADCRRVVAPTQTYAQTYTPIYAQSYGYETVIVPKAYALQVTPQFYAGVGEEYRQQEMAKAIARELYSLIEASKQVGPPAYVPPTGNPPVGVPPVPNIPNPPSIPDVIPKESLKGRSAIQLLLDARCVSCHDKNGEKPLLTDASKVSKFDRLESFHSVSIGKMPKKGDKLTQEQFNLMAEWVRDFPPAPPKK